MRGILLGVEQWTMKKELSKLKLIVDNEDKKLATAGKEPPIGNWLSKLEIGTCFLCREKNSANFLLFKFIVRDKIKEVGTTLLNDEHKDLQVDNIRFCNRFDYVTTECIFRNEEEE